MRYRDGKPRDAAVATVVLGAVLGVAVSISSVGAGAIGVRLSLMAIPLWLLPLAGLFSRFMKEVVDVGFTWDDRAGRSST